MEIVRSHDMTRTPQNEYHKMKPKNKAEKDLAVRIEVIASYICAEVLMTMAREVMGGKGK